MDKTKFEVPPECSEALRRISETFSDIIRSSLLPEEVVNSIAQSILQMNEVNSRVIADVIRDIIIFLAESASLDSSRVIGAAVESVRTLNDYVFQRNTDLIELKAEHPEEKRNFAEKIEMVASKYQVSLGLLISLITLLVTIAFEAAPDKDVEEIRDNQQTIIAKQEAELAQNKEVIELLTDIRDNGEYSELELKDLLKQLEDTLDVGIETTSDSKDVSDQAVDVHDLRSQEPLVDREEQYAERQNETETSEPSE